MSAELDDANTGALESKAHRHKLESGCWAKSNVEMLAFAITAITLAQSKSTERLSLPVLSNALFA
jgi:hypothetical protein